MALPDATSYWAATAADRPARPPARGPVHADVAIVGAGYTGLSAALRLAEAGLSVVVLEAERAGWGASGRNGGQIHSGQRLDQEALENLVGAEDAMRLWRQGEEAKALVADLVAHHGIDCDLGWGLIHADHRARLVPASHAYVRHLQERYGYDAIEPLSRDALREIVGSPLYRGGFLDHGGGFLHPLNYALGLARAAEGAGAVLHEGSRVIALNDDGPVTLRTAEAEITVDFAVMAGDAYLGRLVPDVDRRLANVESHVIATEPLDEALARSVLARPVAVSDSLNVIDYFRMTADRRLVFGGGESHGLAGPADAAGIVRKAMLRVFPQLSETAIAHAWTGRIGLTVKRLPYIRALGPRLFVAAGYSGQGVALATLTGRVLADAIAGRPERLELLSRLPCPVIPVGPALKKALVAAALFIQGLRDRL